MAHRCIQSLSKLSSSRGQVLLTKRLSKEFQTKSGNDKRWQPILNDQILTHIFFSQAIFELINTEATYVRDLQLVVEIFYTSLLPILSMKETTVIFANVEDLLLVNTVSYHYVCESLD